MRRQSAGTGWRLPACVLPLAAAGAAWGQASFVENFDSNGPTNPSDHGPSGLIARGWIFRNQSNPEGSRGWFDGYTNSGWTQPQSGAGYLAVDSLSTDYFGGQVSTWAILPPVANQQAGDVLTFYAMDQGGDNVNTLEVRYSPSGGDGTGVGPDDVGDFTELLLHLDPITVGGWNRYQVTLPGSGRIALRYSIDQACNWACFASYTGLDTLSVGEPPPPACNQPPLPSPGQTVTWTAAGGPYRVCENIGIPAGATVNVEPGVQITFDAARQLVVSGTLNINGTDGAPVVLAAPNIFPPFVVVQGGTLEAHHADFGQQLRINGGANVRLYDSTFTSDGSNQRGGMLIAQELQDPMSFIRLERCAFTDSLMTLSDAVVVLEDNVFTNTYALILRGYADVTETNTFVGAPLEIVQESGIQPFFVDGVHATGVAGGAGLRLAGSNFLLGPNNSLQGNGYPVDIDAGLMPGSAVPATGNASNKILAGNGGSRRLWPDFGIPYLLYGSGDAGTLRVFPGVTVEARPGTSMFFNSTGTLESDGLPGAPIQYRGEGAGPWGGLLFAHQDGPRLEYNTIENAAFGVISTDTVAVYLQNCIFRHNSVGANANSYGSLFIEKSRFLSNTAGISMTDLGGVWLIGFEEPNAFEGNDAAIDAFEFGSNADANLNWWGHPTGPQHPQNPGGQGDPIVGPGASGVSIFPFLESPPDFANTPPVVRMQDVTFYPSGIASLPDQYFEPGEKTILRWEASDNAGITGQSIRLSPSSHYPTNFTVPIAEDLPPGQRSAEITIPDIGFALPNNDQYLRIAATDAAGQEGWDETIMLISSGRITGDLDITTDLTGRTFTFGQPLPEIRFTGTASGLPTIEVFVLLEADGGAIGSFTSSQYQYALFFGGVPAVSTDAARLAIRAHNNSNDVKWFFEPGYFSIRHDPRLGFVPPVVQLQTPAAGASFPGGSVVPIAWTASAAEGLYGFDIQASYNGGRTWRLIAERLPASARSFDWRLPPSTGIPDVRVRVIARDLRFQNSTSGHNRVFSITPGGAGCAADFDGNGSLTLNDFVQFRNAYVAGDLAADFDGNGTLTLNDFVQFRNAYTGGC